MLRRRGFFGLAAGLLMAPSVVKASSIMPVRVLGPEYPIVGYKGREFDAAAFYAPYVPLTTTGVEAGSAFYNTTTRTMYFSDGTEWKPALFRTRYDN